MKSSHVYLKQEEEKDNGPIRDCLVAIDKLRKKYGDVVAIPDVITLVDVSRLVLSTPHGPRELAKLANRDELKAVLCALKDNPCADPEQVAYYAINDYRETQTTTHSKES